VYFSLETARRSGTGIVQAVSGEVPISVKPIGICHTDKPADVADGSGRNDSRRGGISSWFSQPIAASSP
jgi:hypothetical protein